MSIPSELPPEVQQRLTNELRPGERVAWSAQPSGTLATKASCIIYVFAIPWTTFSVFWMIMASQAGWLFALFGLPFVLVGLGMFKIPSWIKKIARQSVYAITDQRAITIKAGLFSSFTVKSYNPEQLQDIERTEYKDGSGDLIFHKYYTRDSDGDQRLNREGFEGIPQVKQVEALIQAMVATHQVAKREAEGE